MLLRKFDCSTGSGPFSRDKGSDTSLSFNAPKQQEVETVLLLSCLIRFGTQSRGRVNEFGVISFTSLGWFIVNITQFLSLLLQNSQCVCGVYFHALLSHVTFINTTGEVIISSRLFALFGFCRKRHMITHRSFHPAVPLKMDVMLLPWPLPSDRTCSLLTDLYGCISAQVLHRSPCLSVTYCFLLWLLQQTRAEVFVPTMYTMSHKMSTKRDIPTIHDPMGLQLRGGFLFYVGSMVLGSCVMCCPSFERPAHLHFCIFVLGKLRRL